MVSMNSSTSVQSAPVFVPRSSSFTNVKKASQQHLAQSLRSNRVDTPTNINIQHLSPANQHTQHTPRTASKPTFQSNNILKNSSYVSIASGDLAEHPTHHNSDSDPSSLSNYTLNRSLSNTPQTSINTSVDDVGNAVPKGPKSDPASDISKSNSLESIRETEVTTITSSDAVAPSPLPISKPVLSAVESADASSVDSGVENLSTVNEVVTPETEARPEFKSSIDQDSPALADLTGTSDTPATDNDATEIETADTTGTSEPPESGIEASASQTELTSAPEAAALSLDLDNDLDQGNDGNSKSNSECDSASSRTLHETHSYETPVEAKGDSSPDSSHRNGSAPRGPDNSDQTPKIPQLPDGSHKPEVSSASPGRSEHSDDELRELPSEAKGKKNKNGLSIDVPSQKDAASASASELKTPKDRITASSSTKSFESVSRLIEGYQEDQDLSPPVRTPRTNFFDFQKDNTFDRLLNDEQGTPPRGDVAIMGNKIRKHHRSASSMSSFNSVVNDQKAHTSEMGSPVVQKKSQVSPDRSSLPAPNLSFNGLPSHHSFRKSSGPKSNLGVQEQSLEEGDPESQLKVHKKVPPTTPKAMDVEITDNVVNGSYNEHSPEPPAPISKDNTPKKPRTKSMLAVVENVASSAKQTASTAKQSVSAAKQTAMKKGLSIQAPPAKRDYNKALPRLPITKEKISVDVNLRARSESSSHIASKQQRSKSPMRSMVSGITKSPLRSNKTTGAEPKSPLLQPKLPVVQTPKSPSFHQPKGPSRQKSMPNMAQSGHTGHLMLFWKKFKGEKVPLPPAPKVQSKEVGDRKKPFFGKVPKFRLNEGKNKASVSLEPPAPPPARELVLVRNSMYDLTLTKLPTIEADTSLLDDVLNSFNESSTSERNIKGINTEAGTKDPFLRDDELTRDQIKDQQKRDRIAMDGDEDNDTEIGPGHARNNSDEAYTDENLRFLQEELLWPIDADFKAFDDASRPGRRKSYDTIRRSLVFDAEPDSETFILENFELKNLFDNTTEQQRRQLPFHLKHIGQFTDFDRLEIRAEKFKMTPTIPKQKPLATMPPSLRAKGSSKPRRKVEFDDKISITETFSPDFYKRYNKAVTQYTLTESLEILRIKSELNTYKCNEMLVHENSQQNTHFFY